MDIPTHAPRPLAIMVLDDKDATGLVLALQKTFQCPVSHAGTAKLASEFYADLRHKVVIVDPVQYCDVSGAHVLDHDETVARTRFINEALIGRSRLIVTRPGPEEEYQRNWGKRAGIDYHAFVQKGTPVDQVEQAIAYALALPPIAPRT